MKILLDMNMPEVWEDFLNAAGFAAMHWSRVGDIRAQDEEIMEWARRNGHMVLTHDLDFGALLYATNARAPSVMQVRAEHIVPRVLGTVVLGALRSVADQLEAGALVTVDPRRQRIRLLPLRGDA